MITWRRFTQALLAILLLSLLFTSALPAHADTIYVIQRGDNLYRISLRFGVTIAAIKQANGLTSNLIFAGQTLVIPGVSGSVTSTPSPNPTSSGSPTTATYTVQRGDTLWRIATRNGTTVAALKAANKLTSDLIFVGQVLLIPGGKPAATATPTSTPAAFSPKLALEVQDTSPANHYLDGLWSADGKLLVLKTLDSIDIHEAPAFNLKHSISASYEDSAPFALSPDTHWLAIATKDNSIQLWEVSSGQLRFTLTGHTAKVVGLVFSPDNTTLASLGFINQTGTPPFPVEIRVWGVSDGKQLIPPRNVGNASTIGSVYFLENRVLLTHLIVGDACSRGFTSTLAAWSLEAWFAGSANPDPNWQRTYPKNAITDLTVNTGSKYIAGVLGSEACIGTRGAMIWNSKTGEETLHVTEVANSTAGIYAGVAASPQSQIFAINLINGADTRLHLIDGNSGQEAKSYAGEIGADSRLALSADGTLASAANGVVSLWNINTGQRMFSLPPKPEQIAPAGFSPDGRWLVTQTAEGSTRHLHIWQVKP